MSADWFCKIGEKKIGPLNGQQLKTIVAKGQLKPDHLVRRGGEGPWVPAGRIKGLFPGGPAGDPQPQAKKAAPTAGKPQPKPAKAGALPTATEAPAPPAAEIPQELALGGHDKHHVQMNVDKFDIETTPVMVSRKKVRSGLQGLKKSQQKQAKVILLSVIGGGTAFGLLVFIWAATTGKLSSAPKPSEEAAASASDSATPASAAAKPSAEKPAAPKAAEYEWPRSFKSVSIENTLVGDVDVMVLKPSRGPPPEGIKTAESEVLIVPVNLKLKEGAKKNIDFAGWADAKVKKDVMLKDDEKGTGNSFELLGQVAKSGDEPKEITDKRIQIHLIFELPGKMPKTMYLALPSSAFHVEGKMAGYKFDSSDISTEAAKSAAPSASSGGDKADAAHKDDAK